MSSSAAPQQASRQALRDALREATRRLHRAAARALASGCLCDAGLLEIRQLLRLGSERRRLFSPHADTLLARYEDRARELESVVSTHVTLTMPAACRQDGGRAATQAAAAEAQCARSTTDTSVVGAAGPASSGPTRSLEDDAPPAVLPGGPGTPALASGARAAAALDLELLRDIAVPDAADILSAVRPSPLLRVTNALGGLTARKRADELDAQQLAIVARRSEVVTLMGRGQSARAALEALGLPITLATIRRAQRWRHQLAERGHVHDLRWQRDNAPTVAVPAVVSVVLFWYFGRPAANARGIELLVRKHIEALRADAAARDVSFDVPVPSIHVVRKIISRIPKPLKAARRGLQTWVDECGPVGELNLTTHANHTWHIDHTELGVWARVEINGRWVVVELYLTVALDVHTRAVAGFLLTAKAPDAWTTSLVFWHAVRPKPDPGMPVWGLPGVLVPDHGPDFMSHAVASAMKGLHVHLDPCPPHYPNLKAEVERFFGTVKSEFVPTLPGAKDAIGSSRGAAERKIDRFLTVPHVRAEFTRWVAEVYHARRHSATGRRPAEYWAETRRLSAPLDEGELAVLLLKDDEERTVGPKGVRFGTRNGQPRYYTWPSQADWSGTRVRVRYNPEDEESIQLYDAATSAWVAEAWDKTAPNPRFDAKAIADFRGVAREGVAERLRAYFDEIAAFDRRMAVRSGAVFSEARALNAKLLRRLGVHAPEEDTGSLLPGAEVSAGGVAPPRPHPALVAAVAAPALRAAAPLRLLAAGSEESEPVASTFTSEVPDAMPGAVPVVSTRTDPSTTTSSATTSSANEDPEGGTDALLDALQRAKAARVAARRARPR